MSNQALVLAQLVQSILEIESAMPAASTSMTCYPIKEESDENKENIPPTPEPFNIERDLVSLYDKVFPDSGLYHLFVQQNLLDIIKDPDYLLFDSAYCCHRLLAGQEKALITMKQSLTNMQNALDKMLSDTQHFDRNHRDNARTKIPALVKKGLELKIKDILPERPVTTTIPPRTPANSVQSEPALPTRAPAPKPKKGNCPDCRRPYQYDHVAWCRGQTDGWTCRCEPKSPTPLPTEPSPATGSNNIPVRPPLATIYVRKCHTCNSPHHTKARCPRYRCAYCHRAAPGHLVKDCTIKKLKDRNRNQPVIPELPPFSEDDGFYDIHGDEDGNLNGEC
jgi:hypothetical protein